MFAFLKSHKRKEKERLEKEALEARQKRLAQQPYKRNPPHATTQQIDGSDYSAAYWLSQPTNFVPEQRSFISANDTSNKLSEGSGSFSGAGVGDTMILNVFPDLWFSVPYQRCSLMDDKIKAKFDKLDSFIVQRKEYGSFAYLVKEAGKAAELITRAGSRYPTDFASALAAGLPNNYVIVGKLLVEENDVELDRKTGNGILNSILKGGDFEDNLKFKLSAWDCITPNELKLGKSATPYKQRMSNLEWVWKDIVPTYNVKSLKEAYAIYSKFTADGKEGAVLKTHNFTWANGTSKDCIKLKIEFECDLEVVAITEGTGKAMNMMGSLTLKSGDGLIVTDCGSGFSDNDRMDWWLNSEERIGSIVTIRANDIISSKNKNLLSLFLPIFLEIRLDKHLADSSDHCMLQLKSAKGSL